jgi:hypothetical protein
MPLYRRLHLLLDQPLDQVRAHNILSEPLLLQKFEVAQCRPRIGQILEVRRFGPVLQIGKVGDEGGLGEELLRRKMVQVVRIGERLYELYFFSREG